MAPKLKRQHQLFVDAYIAGNRNGTKAAVAAGYSPKTARVQASRLLASAAVKAAVDAAVIRASAKAGITLENHLKSLEGLRDRADAASQYSAAITAEVSRGKASSLYIERHEHSGDVSIRVVNPYAEPADG